MIEKQKVIALQTYRNATVDLEREQGTILSAYNIQIDDTRDPILQQRKSDTGGFTGLW